MEAKKNASQPDQAMFLIFYFIWLLDGLELYFFYSMVHLILQEKFGFKIKSGKVLVPQFLQNQHQNPVLKIVILKLIVIVQIITI